ncbi:LacI family DNA-binding transcriptional regulator [Cohnella sp. 56]|uniref:LacI family DNA-binding transcriptional regulator n=1 Tax=Cohnella sp. 56 TaxID=3113722 RepID=UPI0030E956EF
MKKVTLQMIADKVGVSKALVSKALSHDPAVKDETKNDIWRTAEELGYPVHLRNNKRDKPRVKTGYIAVIMPRAYLNDFEYWGRIMRGIEQAISEKGYTMILAGIDLASVSDTLPAAIKVDKIDGALVLGHIAESAIEELESRNIPFAMIDTSLLSPDLDHILSNNYLGAYDAVGRILKVGHRQIGFVGDVDSAWSFTERARGCVDAVKMFNAASPNTKATIEWISGVGASGTGNYIKPEFGEQLIQAIHSKSPVTAFFCANDMFAFDTINRLAEEGMSSPEDYSIVGFDDLSLAGMMHPKLTTVRVAKESIGYRAVEILLRRIAQPDSQSEVVMVGTKFVERDTLRSADDEG